MGLHEYRQIRDAYRAARVRNYTPAQGRREALGLLLLVAGCLALAALFGAFR